MKGKRGELNLVEIKQMNDEEYKDEVDMWEKINKRWNTELGDKRQSDGG